MKKILSIGLLISAFVLVAFAQTISIKIKGSDTVLPLSQDEAEKYMKSHKGSSITVTGGGSGVGIAALMDGSTDIAQSSRSLKMEEKLKFKDKGHDVKEVQIAWDALTVVVNPSNPIKQLTREQIEGIYTGKITNWKQVGGKDLAIVAYSRESSSGTYEFFKDHVMNKKNFGTAILNMPATGSIVQSVTQTKGAIGYIGLAYMEKTIKALDISYDGGKSFIKATASNAKAKKYPITRPLFYYYDKKIEKNVMPFISYVLSKEGQKSIELVGYIPVK